MGKKMNTEYKEFIIRGIYGLIEGSAQYLESMLKSSFNLRFGFNPDSLGVTQEDEFLQDDVSNKGCWIGKMTAILIINEQEFVVTRDWAEEHENDKKHPNYKDDYFFESEDCFSCKKCNELLESISPKGIARERFNNM